MVSRQYARQRDAHPPPHSLLDPERHFRTTSQQAFPLLRYKAGLTSQEAVSLLRDHVHNTNVNRGHLDSLIDTSGDNILSSWRKMDVSARMALLTAGKEHVAKTVFATERTVVMSPMNNHSSNFLCMGAEWLAFDALASQPSKLLCLLRERVERTPAEWAPFDIRQTVETFACGLLPVHFNAAAICMHGEKYGTMVEWDEAATRTWAIAGFPRGFPVVQVQQMIMEFLRFMADGLVDTQFPRGNNKWLRYAKQNFARLDREQLISHYTLQPFRPPQESSAASALCIAQTQCKRIRGDIERMQVDAVYMHRTVQELRRDMRFEDSTVPSTVRHKVVTRTLMSETITSLIVWERFEAYCLNACQQIAQLRLELPDGADLNHAILGIMLQLCNEAKICHRAQHKRIAELVALTRSFKDLITVTGEHDGHVSHELDDGKVELTGEHAAIIRMTMSPGAEDEPWLFEREFTILERWTMANGNTRSSDDHLCRLLSALEAADQIVMMCEFSQIPSYGHREQKTTSPTVDKSLLSPTAESVKLPLIDSKSLAMISDMVDDLSRTEWPSGPHDMAWFHQTSKRRKVVHAIWEVSCDAYTTSRAEYNKCTTVLDGPDLKFYELPKHVEALAAEQQACEALTKSANQAITSPAQSSWGHTEEVKPTQRSITSARYARDNPMDTAPVTLPAPPILAPIAAPPVPLPRIPVNGKTMAVLRRMFPPPGTKFIRDTKWKKFLLAMTDAGCGVRPTGGSPYEFNSEDGKLTFHKPHPKSRIEKDVLKEWGKRCHESLGWDLERFVLEKK